MCNGKSSRQSYGGTIAILKSASSDLQPSEMSLLLADDQHTGNTSAMLNGAVASHSEDQVVIQ